MRSPSDVLGPALVLDASALINLIATEDPVAVLDALPNPIVLEEVVTEIRRHPRTGTIGPDVIAPLLAGPLTRVALDEHDADRFVALVSAAPPDDLDDGEAATISYATRRGLACVIDERKGHRILGQNFEGCPALTTVTVYRELLVQGVFDRDFIATCLYDSLRFARMRIVAADMGWVTDLLGPDRVAACPSLRRHYRR
jgi:predicted nucleic acid-binding protein